MRAAANIVWLDEEGADEFAVICELGLAALDHDSAEFRRPVLLELYQAQESVMRVSVAALDLVIKLLMELIQ